MDRGTTSDPVVVALAMIALACSGADREWESQDLTPGYQAPSAIGALHPAATKIVWLLRSEDCASCSLPTRDVRRLQRSVQPVPPLIVVVIGGSADLVREFLRQERIAATVLRMKAAAYRATFGSTPLPTLFAVYRDTVIGRWQGAGWVGRHAISHRADLEQILSRLTELEPAVGRASSPGGQ